MFFLLLTLSGFFVFTIRNQSDTFIRSFLVFGNNVSTWVSDTYGGIKSSLSAMIGGASETMENAKEVIENTTKELQTKVERVQQDIDDQVKKVQSAVEQTQKALEQAKKAQESISGVFSSEQ